MREMVGALQREEADLQAAIRKTGETRDTAYTEGHLDGAAVGYMTALFDLRCAMDQDPVAHDTLRSLYDEMLGETAAMHASRRCRQQEEVLRV